MSADIPVFRVDKFIVPEIAKDEFLKRVHEVHAILHRQPGFIRDLVLQQVAGPGRFNIVTLVGWASQEFMDAARTVVTKIHAERQFSPQETIARLGISADIGNYRQIAV